MGIRNVYYQLLYLLAVNVFLLRNADFIFRKCGMFDLGIVNKLQQFETSDCRMWYRPFHTFGCVCYGILRRVVVFVASQYDDIATRATERSGYIRSRSHELRVHMTSSRNNCNIL